MADDEEAVQALRIFFEDPNVRFPVKPRLVEDLGTYQMPDGLGFQFRGGPVPIALRGREAARTLAFLLPALDGTRGFEDLLEQCPPEISRGTLLKALSLLHTKGLLAEANPPEKLSSVTFEVAGPEEGLRRQLLFWGRKLGVTGSAIGYREVQRKLESADLLLIGTGLFGAMTYDLLTRSGCSSFQVITWDDSGFLADSLRGSPHLPRHIVQLASTSVDEMSARVRELVGTADLVVTATRNAPARLFRSLNRICLDVGCALLCADEDGTQVVIGPYVQPYSSACYTCMELRRASARDFMLEEHLYQEHLATERPLGTSLPMGEAVPVAAMSSSLLAMEIVRIITGITPPTVLNGQLTVPLLSGELQSHRILRVPRCPDCRRGGRIPSVPE
jgi:bacteriocin biosynthesis cyclodehydratase domain-containing protein